MGQFSIWHLLIVLVIVLIFFGPNRLPGLGNSLGKAIRGFKDGLKGLDDEDNTNNASNNNNNKDQNNKS